ncbi:hypothetical protein ACLOJK_019603 [Asimina triloba]
MYLSRGNPKRKIKKAWLKTGLSSGGTRVGWIWRLVGLWLDLAAGWSLRGRDSGGWRGRHSGRAGRLAGRWRGRDSAGREEESGGEMAGGDGTREGWLRLEERTDERSLGRRTLVGKTNGGRRPGDWDSGREEESGEGRRGGAAAESFGNRQKTEGDDLGG